MGALACARISLPACCNHRTFLVAPVSGVGVMLCAKRASRGACVPACLFSEPVKPPVTALEHKPNLACFHVLPVKF